MLAGITRLQVCFVHACMKWKQQKRRSNLKPISGAKSAFLTLIAIFRSLLWGINGLVCIFLDLSDLKNVKKVEK